MKTLKENSKEKYERISRMLKNSVLSVFFIVTAVKPGFLTSAHAQETKP